MLSFFVFFRIFLFFPFFFLFVICSGPGISLAKRMIYILVAKMVLNYEFYSNEKELPLFTNDTNVANLMVKKRVD